MISGVKLLLGTTEYCVPALNMAQMEEYREDLDRILATEGSVVPSKDKIDSIMKVAKASLSRNYPDIQEDELRDVIDANNIFDIISAILGNDKKKVVTPDQVDVSDSPISIGMS